ncbi:MAG: hypothetical protein WDO73_32375 [Ignavibacteriota bacterium]
MRKIATGSKRRRGRQAGLVPPWVWHLKWIAPAAAIAGVAVVAILSQYTVSFRSPLWCYGCNRQW